MPKQSNRAELQQLLLYFGIDGHLSEDDALLSHEEILAFLVLLETQRFAIQKTFVPKTSQWWQLAFNNLDYDDTLFKSQFRMGRDAFHFVLQQLAGNVIKILVLKIFIMLDFILKLKF